MFKPFQILLLIVLFTSPLLSQKILFRYNADYTINSDLNSQTAQRGVIIDTRYEDEEETARGADGWGYSTHKTALFFTDSSSVYSHENIQINYFGNHEVSGEIWMKTFTETSDLFSWDDSLKSNGITISMSKGKLVISRKINNEVFTFTADQALNMLEWYNIIWYNKVEGNLITLGFIVDRKDYGQQQFDLVLPAGLSSIAAPIFIGNNFNTSSTPFNGEIYTVLVRNYIPAAEYLYTALPDDGSGYMGLASFHDYPVSSANTVVDRRITSSPTSYINPIFLPYADEDFIPQGLTNSYEDEEFRGEGMVYSAMYHKTLDDRTGLQNSIVIEIDPVEQKIRRTFRLTGILKTSHVGGIAFHNNSIYVSSSRKIEIYPIPEYKEGDEKYQDLTSSEANIFNVASQASFSTYFDDTLWVGDYRLSNEGFGYLYGYPLEDDGKLTAGAVPTIYRLPYQAQGAAWKIYKGQKYLFISTSGGDAGSKVHRVKEENLFKSEFPKADTVFGVPAGGEDLTFNNQGDLINQSESGAKYFQKRSSPWKTYFPFIFTIKEEVLFGDLTTGLNDSNSSIMPEKYNLRGYPNPFNSTTNINFSLPQSSDIEISIYDTLGNEITQLNKGHYSAGSHTTTWNAHTNASGTYLIVMKSSGKIVSSNKILLLK